MQQHIALLTAFADFQEQFPKAGLDDFYQYMLRRKTAAENPAMLMPTEGHNRLMRAIGRLYSSFNMYMRAALKELDMKVPEGYPFLATLHFMGPMRRTDLIHFVLTELSTGSEILNRLRKQGWITEEQDQEDRRVKRVSINDAGRKVLMPCLEKAGQIRTFMLGGLSEADSKNCAALLEPAEELHSATVLQLRHRSVDDIMGD